MYLHIGGNRMIDVRRLVALFKAHPSRASKANPLMQYYKPYEYVGNSTEKDWYICSHGRCCVWFTPVSFYAGQTV